MASRSDRPEGTVVGILDVNSPVAEVRRAFTGPRRRVIYLGEVTYRGDFIHVEFDQKA